MNVTDLPNTPRAAFAALTGKRPDLTLLAAPADLAIAALAGRPEPGAASLYFGVWCAPERQPLLIQVGGAN